MGRVEGKVAVITGGASGIGEETARRFAAEGARVVVADLNLERAEQVAHEIGGDAIAIGFDAGDVESTEALIARTVDHFGRIDAVHNNAAWTSADVGPADTTILETSVETWDKTMRINARSVFVTTRAALPHMLAQGGGTFINMGSGAAVRGGARSACYGTSKAAVANFTRYAAVQYGRQNVRSNCILPGFILTPATTAHVSDGSATVPHLPFHRDGLPSDIAALVLFLASDEAQFMNGQVIAHDGGFTAGDAKPSRLDMNKA